MEDASDRRTFLRNLASQAVRGAQAISPIPNALERGVGERETAGQAETPLLGPAAPASRFADHAELLGLAAALDLENRGEDLKRLVRTSARLSLAVEEVESVAVGFAGGEPELPVGVVAALGAEPAARFLACVDLDAVARALEHRERPSLGRIWIFAGPGSEPQISFEPGDPNRDPTAGAGPDSEPLHASAELVLPRPWSAGVEELELSQRELVAWQRLRQQLAHAQGVETADTAQRPAPIHRVFGYPDETPSAPPLPRSGGPLLQLSTDPDFDWHWGSAESRLYVWAPASSLRSGNLNAAQALVR